MYGCNMPITKAYLYKNVLIVYLITYNEIFCKNVFSPGRMPISNVR